MGKFNAKFLDELNLKGEFSRELVNNYLQRFEIMKNLCGSFVQVIFCLAYSQYLHVVPKYEHILLFKYIYSKYLNSISGYQDGRFNQQVVWVRSFDSNNLPYFQFVVLVDVDSLSHWQELIETATQHWGMVLGSDDPFPISICNNQDGCGKLTNGLIYEKNCSEFEQIRQERLLLQQILILAKLIGQESTFRDGWMKRSNRPGEYRHII